MKKIFLILLLTANTVFGQTLTNGVFTVYKGNSNYELVGKNQPRGVKEIILGRTYEVDKAVYSITTTTNNLVLYFSNDLTAKLYTNSEFSVNSFTQEVFDINSEAKKSKFGSHILTTSLMNGEGSFVFNGGDSNSSCIVSTPLLDVELFKGKFYFKVTDKSVVVFVLDGSAKAHGERSEDLVPSGKVIVAAPIQFRTKGFDDKVFINIKKSKSGEELGKLVTEVTSIGSVSKDILFSVVNGKTVGVNIN